MGAAQPRIDLVRHLQFFVALADDLHFGRAADAVGVSQPPLSQGLRRLEKRLGSSLFDRDSRGVALTRAGAALLPHARQILTDVEVLLTAAADARDDPLGIRFGVAPQVPTAAVAALLTTARCSLPGQRVELATAPSQNLLDEINAGRLDVAVLVHPAPLAGTQAGPVVRLQGRLLIAADHPIAQRDSPSVGLRDLARALPLALPPREHHPAAHDHLLDVIARYGVQTSLRHADDDRSAVLAAASGKAAALTADPNLLSASVRNIAIDGDPLPLRLRLVCGTAAKHSPSSTTIEALQKSLELATATTPQ